MVILMPLAMFLWRGILSRFISPVESSIEEPEEALIAGHFVNALESSGWIGMTVEEIAGASGSSVEEADAVFNFANI